MTAARGDTPSPRIVPGRWYELPWHTPLLATALIFAQYLGQITSIMAIWRPLLILVIASVAVAAAAGLIARSIQRGALVASASLLLLRGGDASQAVTGYVVVLAGLAAIALTMRWRRIQHPSGRHDESTECLRRRAARHSDRKPGRHRARPRDARRLASGHVHLCIRESCRRRGRDRSATARHLSHST